MEINKKKAFVGAVLVLLVLAVGAAGLVFLKVMDSRLEMKLFARSDYQAVFLSNGQVYFGKLSKNEGWYVLKDVYYLQVTEDLQPASGDSGADPAVLPSGQNPNQQVGLVKLGSELHGPEDAMFISRENLLFWENLKSDSQVVQRIRDYRTDNPQ